MTDLDRIRSILEQERYTQGFNAVPVYLNRAGYSGIAMEREVGVRYSGFVVRYQRGWAEYGYLISDFERIWETLKERWLHDPSYFVNLKRAYDQRFAGYDDLLRADLGDRLSAGSDDEFMALLDRARRSMVDVGISAHATEAISWGADRELRRLLEASGLVGRALDEQVSALTAPDKLSWVAQEQQSLEAVQPLSSDARGVALSRHLNEWYWISNSYAGRRVITIRDLEDRLASSGAGKTSEVGSPRTSEVEETTTSPTDDVRQLVELLQFITLWHDERKAKVLRAIDGLAQTLDELARRAPVERIFLDYLTVGELDSLTTITDVGPLAPPLAERIDGVWSLIDEHGDTPFTGHQFTAVDELRATLEATAEHADELHGNTAQPGRVEGPVALCLSLDAIASFPAGAVLVTSMTRPEFMPAIKKAAAIVTDEGGITCHAAIVARELGKPCIIGTKVATKLLHDGELVEVNANHGTIRRIGAEHE